MAPRVRIMAHPLKCGGNGMFLDIKELAVRKIRIRKSYASGTVDYHIGEFRQVEPLEVRATADVCGHTSEVTLWDVPGSHLRW